MQIEQNKVVSIAYVVTQKTGALIDQVTIDAPLEYLHGHNNLILGLEQALESKRVGAKFEVELTADLAYGEYATQLVQRVPLEVFEDISNIELGMRFMAQTASGSVPVEITAIEGDEVVVDGNHPLAGEDLVFNVEVLNVRDATVKELEAKTVTKAMHKCDGSGTCGNGGCGEHHHGSDECCCS